MVEFKSIYSKVMRKALFIILWITLSVPTLGVDSTIIVTILPNRQRQQPLTEHLRFLLVTIPVAWHSLFRINNKTKVSHTDKLAVLEALK